ncbi:MAG TPA: EAL domain-containing protein [Sphingomonas sp.]|nr:EAL domain-containing protein [Sphingomonas sp.]
MTAPTDAPATPGWGQVLGLNDAGGADWGRVRAAQLNAIRKLAPVRIAVTAMGVAAVCGALSGHASTWMLAVWALAVTATAGHSFYRKLREGRWQISSASLRDLHTESAWAAIMALVWATAPLLLARDNPTDLMIVWVVCVTMMSGAAMGLSVLPLATMAYQLIVGGSLAFATWRVGEPLVALIAGIYAAGMAFSALASGRNFVIHEAQQLQLDEKNEVVSLLLREFDDKGGDWMWQTDAGKCLTHVSPRFAIALGLQPEALEARPLLQVLAGARWETGDFHASLHELAEKLKRREAFSDLTIPVEVGGEVHWWELSASPRFEDGTFSGFRGVGSDVTAARHAADKINQMARFDPLTGLPNRLHVNDALAATLAQAHKWKSRCAFLMIDLDRFKAINDTLGHPIGDRLLMRVAERLRGLIKDGETCGRLGGDEFGVVMADGANTARIEALSRAIIDTLSRPYEVDEHTLYIGASVGYALGPRDGQTVETLVRSADLALYRSKDGGGGSFYAYEPQLHSHAEERRVLEIALRKALERNQLTVHYQPVVTADSGSIESFEALLRWTHPELGNISPAKFVPIAEDTRLIGPIGDWVLMTACQEARNWPDHVRIAVNVSAEQLMNGNFVATVVQALARSGLPANRLELEVTESVFLREGSAVTETLDKLLSLGIRLSLDDFGTGYSSLGYLAKIRFNTIKIDRSFVTAAAKNTPEAIAIIRAVVTLAQSLDMSTTAEGIETERELTLLRDLGAKKIQGYLFGRPMPARDALKLFDNRDRAVA